MTTAPQCRCRSWFCPPMRRRLAGRLCSLLIGAGFVFCCQSSLSQETAGAEDEICHRTAGVEGRIEDIHAAQGVRQTVDVQRGDNVREGQIGCLISAGDIVRPRPGTTVEIKLLSGEIKTVNYGEDANIAAELQKISSKWGRIFTVFRQWAGADADEARKKALGVVGATRSANGGGSPIIMPGMLGLGQQYVDGGRSLYMRWKGGAPPFRIQFLSARTPAAPVSEALATTEPDA